MTLQLTPDLISNIIRLHGSYRAMMARCYTKTNPSFSDYGGRGIYVAKEWHSEEVFIEWALKNGARQGLHLDRIDNNGPYASWNCHYVTPLVNSNNKRNVVMVTAFGETKSVRDWTNDSRCLVSYSTLKQRISYGWEAETAIVSPTNTRRDAQKITAFGETKGAWNWAKDPRCVVKADTLRARVFDYQWDAERALTTPVR